MKRDDQIEFSAVAFAICALLAVVLASHWVVIAIVKGLGYEI